jgi:hypothetical protein
MLKSRYWYGKSFGIYGLRINFEDFMLIVIQWIKRNIVYYLTHKLIDDEVQFI